MLAETKENIAREVGGVISKEVSQLLNAFAASCESIETHFVRLSERIDESEQRIIIAIREEKEKTVREESAKAEKVIRELKN
jgi:hypothetical protein